MKKLKLYAMESLQNVKIEVTKGEHKANVLKILNEFKEYVSNPSARTMALRANDEPNPFSVNSGLCSNITSLYTGYDDYTIQLVKLFREWPCFSGSIQHPIRVQKHMSERAEYTEAYSSGYGMYDKDNEYCRKRLELLDFVINKIDSDFDNYVWVH